MKLKIGDIVDYEPNSYKPLGIVINKSKDENYTVFWFEGKGYDEYYNKSQIMSGHYHNGEGLEFIKHGNKLILLALGKS